VVSIPVAMERTSTTVYKTGSKYFIPFNEFHSVEYIGNTITYLRRSPIITNFAQVIYPINKDVICPFSKALSDDELYQIIEDTINY
jgi:hypothetical protein